MAQSLSYIERELKSVEAAAANATRQMADLENELRRVIETGQRGRGAARMTGTDVGRIAEQTVGAVGSPHAPTGSRGLLGGGESAREMNRLALEIKALEGELKIHTVVQKRLTQAETKLAGTVQERATIENEAITATRTRIQLAYESIAAGKAVQMAEKDLPKSLLQRVTVWKEEEAAAKELAKVEKEAATKLGAMVKGETTRASTLAKTGTGKGGGAQPAKVYSQQDLERIFSRAPGTAGKIGEVAKRYKFGPEDIKRVTEYANSYTQLQFAAKNANGVMRKLVLTADRAGNVMTSTQKQFRTFFGSIKRNVTEMIKWSAATLMVWGAIRKVGELLEIAIENETRLASIAVILGEEHVNLTNVFNAAAEAAAATGEAIDGVLEGYVQAYRATGNIADQTERARQAQVLLVDALTLSKLSTLTTAQSMDTLTGALRQAGLGFEEGYVLLDKWVAVSRQANVSIETLAESFAITATSASNAGLTWDELNGIIATLAESTTLSATESGNAVRAFIGGFSTDLATKELSKFGIAILDSTGETRGFLDVMQEIAAMFEKGIISEGELNKIARAIGGRGARRGAQVATTIKNLGRAQEVAEISARAHGDAQKALNIQLDTVQTAITKLGNAFQKLARAMGSEGGVLETAGGVLSIFTKMVDATAALVKNLGDMTPILAGIGVLFAVTSAQTRGLFATNIIAGVAGFMNRGTAGRGAMSIEDQRLQAGVSGGFVAGQGAPGPGTRFQQKMLGPGYGRNAGSMLGQGLAAGFTIYSAAKDLSQGNRAGAAGSIVGGILGGLLSGGSPVGIVIGTAAGEAFANATINYKAEFTNLFKNIFDEALPDGEDDKPSDEEEAIEGMFTQFGLGSNWLGRFVAKGIATGMNIGYQGGAVIGNLTGGLGIGGYQYRQGIRGAETSAEQIALAGTLGMSSADETFEIRRQIETMRGFEAEAKPGEFKFAVVEEQKALLVEFEDFIIDLEAAQAEIYRAAAIAGDITPKEAKDAFDQIPKLQSVLTKYEAAFGEALRDIDSEIGSVTDSMEFWTKIVLNSTTEQVSGLNTVATAIGVIRNAMADAAEAGRPDKIIVALDDPETKDINERLEYTRAEAREEERRLQELGVAQGLAQTRAINREKIVLPTVVDLDLKKIDFDLFLAEMQKVQDEAFEGWWAEGLNTDFSATEIAETFAPFFLALGKDGAGKYLEGFKQEFATEAFENLVRRGEIVPDKEDEKIGLQQLDISSGQLPGVMAEYRSLVASVQSQLAARGVEWSPNEETFAALLNDNVAMPITADLTLLNIAMQELIDVSKDQLDGIYNLPTDASFYVPFSGYSKGFLNQGGDGGTGGDLEGYMQGIVDEDEEAVEEIAEIVKPDRWQIEQDARIAEMARKAAQAGVPDWPDESRFEGLTPEMYGYEKPMGIQLPPLHELIFGKGLGGGIKTSIDALKELFGAARGGLDPLGGSGQQLPAGGILNELRDLLSGLFGANGEEPTITTKLQIESTTTTIVQLDGQVIAQAIKPYLLNDEVRYEGTGGAAVKRFVI